MLKLKMPPSILFFFAVLFSILGVSPALADPPAPGVKKKWTVFIFLNGHNNLDAFGKYNLLDMETVGSNDDVNIVVQWAFGNAGRAKRVYIERQSNNTEVLSPVLEEMNNVDMGDLKTLHDFIEWGAKRFPAEHYLIDLWDHGSGWKPRVSSGLSAASRSKLNPLNLDISLDDQTKHSIATVGMGEAMRDAARILGQRVDILGTDACLMAMAEIASEVSDSVDLFVASEESIPQWGWPYSRWLKQWLRQPDADPKQVGRILTQEYADFYNGWMNIAPEWQEEDNELESVTLSALDLRKISAYQIAMRNFTSMLKKLNMVDRQMVKELLMQVRSYTSPDYVDFGHWLQLLENAPLSFPLRYSSDFLATKSAFQDLVVSVNNTRQDGISSGMSIWIPKNELQYVVNIRRYKKLIFDRATQWSGFLSYLYPIYVGIAPNS